MLYEAHGISRFIVVCGYTDYPRSTVIQEDCHEHIYHNNLLRYFLDNDSIVLAGSLASFFHYL